MTSSSVPLDISKVPCGNFMQFQEALKRQRFLDDKIIYELNTSIPTDSFAKKVDAKEKCSQLYIKLKSSYIIREESLSKCNEEYSRNLSELREKRDNNPDDRVLAKQLKELQTSARLLQSEMSVETVLKDRTMKVFNERCGAVVQIQ